MSTSETSLNEFLTDHLTITPKFRLPDDFCVVTCATQNFFPGVQLLYTSLVKTHRNVHLVVWDCGFSQEQKDWAAKQPGLEIRGNPYDYLVKPETKDWPQFNRPYFMMNSPKRYRFWMDCDAIAKASLSPICHHVKDLQPFIVQNPICGPNNRALYDHPLIKARNPSTQESFTVATGVVGLDTGRLLDQKILNQWYELTDIICNQAPELMQYIRNWDEGIFRAVIQIEDLFGMLWFDMHWNEVIWYRHKTIRSAFEHIQRNFPISHILHYYGRPKIWEEDESVKNHLLDIDPHHNS